MFCSRRMAGSVIVPTDDNCKSLASLGMTKLQNDQTQEDKGSGRRDKQIPSFGRNGKTN